MPAAAATSSTLTSSNPRAANRSRATAAMRSWVVAGGRPRRCAEALEACSCRTGSTLPFRHSMPYSCGLGHNCRDPRTERGTAMEPNQQTTDQDELVTETLVEEVSIDGMCGVY